ncbi:hypothetical protein RIF23_05210 [Lipingzhangella sp. LS1_29]|uniref:Secreted protein n=1 Tax=Lipingzhangella rawalii TaxID=2055835 RepID=A0ABU2H307_9ACTN|nr:hypothetical protein [Lipingzhangella rawalii]MDS1269688.1 hypothetical protein [Lipingzhangella rawalii]
MRTPTAFAGPLLTLLLLAGCGNNSADANDDNTGPEWGHTDVFTEEVNGEEIVCVNWESGDSGGLTCDFAPLHQDTENSADSEESEDTAEAGETGDAATEDPATEPAPEPAE